MAVQAKLLNLSPDAAITVSFIFKSNTNFDLLYDTIALLYLTDTEAEATYTFASRSSGKNDNNGTRQRLIATMKTTKKSQIRSLADPIWLLQKKHSLRH